MKEKVIPDKGKHSAVREVFSWIASLLAAILIALIIRSFVFEPVRVEGESMDGTLENGEVMLVSKLDYASTWLSLPWQSPEQQEKAARWITGGEPERFDVVICRYPGRGSVYFVKRVVGLPGDTVELREGYLYVNGERYEEPYIRDEYRTRGPSNGWSFGPVTVPEDHYFVMGDHRNNSNDSRSQGAIPRDAVIGHAGSVVWPLGNIRKIQ